MDGIPAIDRPALSSVALASWLAPQDPVVVVRLADETRAYPLRILVRRQVVNDVIGDLPILVTCCPLTHCARVFDRRTVSLWQQLTGEAIQGALAGGKLRPAPSQTVAFSTFARARPEGPVLTRETGRQRDYARNPYGSQQPPDILVAVGRTAYPMALLHCHGFVEEYGDVVFCEEATATGSSTSRPAASGTSWVWRWRARSLAGA